ncbi:MAG: hypothetical protein OEU36_21025 [Gammaproteobacteria bacterium]|nr:hypothetical protein [Gammaproteobacteria bacterium]
MVKFISFALMFVGGIIATVGLAQTEWHYTIGQPVVAQQSKFCTEFGAVDQISQIFEQQDPRAGYSTLGHHPSCRTVVHSFTPEKLVRQVVIAKDEPSEYVISFVRVLTSEGHTEFLVTTRHVEE